MTTLIVTRGLPGSGKTTYAREWVAEDPEHRARINRDDYRAMCHDGYFGGPDTEQQIWAARDAAVLALLKRGVSVVVDDTNLSSRTVRGLRRLAVLARAEFEVVDRTNVPLGTCLARNALRDGDARVPDEVIVGMWNRFIKGHPYPLPLADEQQAPVIEPYAPDRTKPSAVIVDIDGTVALRGTRDPFDETRVHEDRPNWNVIDVVHALKLMGHRIIFCSGRTDGCRGATVKWLDANVPVGYEALHMRPVHDNRMDLVVKAEIFDKHIRHSYNVIGVLDDRNQVVAMWRSLGLTVFQVAEGDF